MGSIAYTPRLLGDVTRLINAQIGQVPPGWRLSEDQVAATVKNAPRLWQIHYPGEDSDLEDATVCVLDRDRLVAAAQWAYTGQSGRGASAIKGGEASLLWVVASPEAAGGLDALLQELTSRCLNAGCRRITTGRYVFGVGWLGLSTGWPHIIDGLRRAGFEAEERWQVFTGATEMASDCAPPCIENMQLSWEPEETALEWSLRLTKDDAPVAECEAWGIPPHLAGCEGYADWITIEWLGVEKPFRRSGIGRWLLGEQLRRQARRGVNRAILWTPGGNLAAQRLATSLGFIQRGQCLEFEMSELCGARPWSCTSGGKRSSSHLSRRGGSTVVAPDGTAPPYT